MRRDWLPIILACAILAGRLAAWENTDIGSVSAPGSVEISGDTYTVRADGTDIWGTADEFHYMYMPMSGDGEISARVLSVQNTNSWAKAGVMIRERLDATSAHAMVIATPGNGVNLQWRMSSSAGSGGSGGAAINTPVWVRLVREGNRITGYYSQDGNAWSQLGSETFYMAEDVYAGLCLTSHQTGVICTAQFDSVEGSAVAEPWNAQNPFPQDGARQIDSEGTILSWDPGQNPPDTINRYDVYFSNNTSAIGMPATLLCSVPASQLRQCFAGPLAEGTEYSWRVDSVINDANVATGRIWGFTTAVEPIDPCPPADIDGDCSVTLNDLNILSQQWLDDQPCLLNPQACADIAGSPTVDLTDFTALADQWQNRIGPVVINEIHYDPDIKTSLCEFVELHNVSNQSVDLSGWQLCDGIDFVFPGRLLIPADGFLVIAQNASKFQTKFGFAPDGQFVGKLSNGGENICLRDSEGYKIDEVNYQLGFPWPTVGDSPGNSIQLINPGFDNDLGGAWRGKYPTPGEHNTSLSADAPPFMRQVKHSPSQPASNEPVTITVKITDPDGILAVNLQYQIVSPGGYIAINDSAYNSNWLQAAMYDDGTNGDAKAGDGRFTAVLPAYIQQHRRLIRYRITALDRKGMSITAPYDDDPQPNFAYFVYDGVPSWSGSARPGVEPVVEYDASVMHSVPVYHLISKKSDVEACTWIERYGGDQYKWYGTLVYDGKVYDHIRYRARGGVWRYAMGKNMWKFDFNRGHSFQAHDDYGREFDTQWTKLNFSACIQQGNSGQRGEQGMFEALTFGLFNMTGVPAPNTSWLHFRIIDEVAESGADQYQGDFWGLYMTIEQMDGRFLEEHDLPDGNLYKMEAIYGEMNNQGPTAATNGSDIRQFKDTYESNPPAQWWGTNVELDPYYSHVAIQNACHHGDVTSKNNFLYLNPELTANEWGPGYRWWLLPWDTDLTWTTYYGDMSDPFSRANIFSHSAIDIRKRNRVREISDLLWNPDQMNQLIDEFASAINDPGGGLSIVDADRAMWDYNPIMDSGYTHSGKGGRGRFYEEAAERGYSRTFEGMAQVMKDFVVERMGTLSSISGDSAIPYTPVVTADCPNDYPVNSLFFKTNPFGDPQGGYTFAAMKWRIAEVAPYSEAEPEEEGTVLVPQNSVWKYFKGTQEPSPVQGEWRTIGFNDSQWLQGMATIGYGENFIITELDDMKGSYSTVYYRREFEVEDLTELGELTLAAQYDDGINIWINGLYAGSGNTRQTEERPFNATVPNRPDNYNLGTISELDPTEYLIEGTNVISAQVINQDLSGSSDCFFDIRLTASVADPSGEPPVTRPAYQRQRGKYEIQAAWESDELSTFQESIQIPASAVRPGRTYRVRCRMKDNTNRWSHWSAPIEFVAGQPLSVGILENLRITELMYNPADPPSGPTDNDEFEYVELQNIGDETLDLTYVAFTNGINFGFGNSRVRSLDPGQFVLVVKNESAFLSRYGVELANKIAGVYPNKLDNGGERIKLVDLYNGTIADFSYNDSRAWPGAADGAGHSLVPLPDAIRSQPDGPLNYGGNWRASAYIGGSPGAEDPDLATTVVLNELMAHTDYSSPLHPQYDSDDWIELYNTSGASVNLDNWYLSDDKDELKKWAIPAMAMAGHGRISFDEINDFHNPITQGFGLNKAGEELVLSYLPGTSDDRIVDYVRFKGQENFVSLGRYPDGGDYWFTMNPSRANANLSPIPHIVISELMYHPVDPNYEYIELRNPLAVSVSLINTVGPWRLDGAVSYTFPVGTGILTGGRLIVVPFNPFTEPSALNAFTAAYNTGPLTPGADIVGPWSGNLSNETERVAIERPQAPDAVGDSVSWVIVDEVIYSDSAPWPVAADGTGASLHRTTTAPEDSGNDPTNWHAATANPGD